MCNLLKNDVALEMLTEIKVHFTAAGDVTKPDLNG